MKTILGELENIYTWVDRVIKTSRARCRACGACCDFKKFDHVLYATSLEAAYLETRHPEAASFTFTSEACPFTVNGRCTARAGRLLACRTFFCDKSAREEMQDLYEQAYTRIRNIYERHNLPFAYAPLHVLMRKSPSTALKPLVERNNGAG